MSINCSYPGNEFDVTEPEAPQIPFSSMKIYGSGVHKSLAVMLRTLWKKEVLGIPVRLGLLAVISVILIAGVATSGLGDSQCNPGHWGKCKVAWP